MPPRLSLSSHAHHLLLQKSPYSFCPSCSSWRKDAVSLNSQYRIVRKLVRPASTRSSTAINATRNVPDRLKELDEALEQLGRRAAAHVSPSRLGLARRGLEGHDPVVRVAVLSIDADTTAARLIRVLLADPLQPKAEWENALENWVYDGRGLLIRFGDGSDGIEQGNLLPTLAVPSTVLQRNNIEIVIAPLGPGTYTSNGDVVSVAADAYLVPTIGVQTSTSGRNTIVRYPVHKSLVWGTGPNALVSFARLEARSDLQGIPAQTLHRAFDIKTKESLKTDGLTLVDLKLAERALESFRQSVQNSIKYEHGWFDSGMPCLSDWLVEGANTTDKSLKPAIRELVAAAVSSADASIAEGQTRRLKELDALTSSEDTRRDLQTCVTAWSERSHTELQDSLEQAFQTPEWRQLAWWKLFWRVDDVSMIATDIIERCWLTQAEKEVTWIGGRLHQAGLTDENQVMINPAQDLFTRAHNILNQTRDLLDETEQIVDRSLSIDLTPIQQTPLTTTNTTTPTHPSPSPPPAALIPSNRNILLQSWIPTLHATAQHHLLISLTTTATTSALSILAYTATTTTSPYEAASIAAVGFVYSLRRLQKKWETERRRWADAVREQGRRVLRSTEDGLRVIVKEGGRPQEDDVDISLSKEARECVERAKGALEKL